MRWQAKKTCAEQAVMDMPANSADMHKHVFYAMSRCRYFDGIPSQKYSNVLSCLQAKVRTFRKGEIIFRFHQQSNYAGIVVTGMVQQNIYDDCGKPIMYDISSRPAARSVQNFHAALRLRALRKYYARQIVQCFFATSQTCSHLVRNFVSIASWWRQIFCVILQRRSCSSICGYE